MTARGAAVAELLRTALAALARLECEEREAIRGGLLAYLDASNQDGAALARIHVPRAIVRDARGERGDR